MQWLGLDLGDGQFDAVPYPWVKGEMTDWRLLLVLARTCVYSIHNIYVVTADNKSDAIKEARHRVAFLASIAGYSIAGGTVIGSMGIPREEPECDDYDEDEDEEERSKRRFLTPERLAQIDEALAESGGVANVAAKKLGISCSALRRHMNKPELRHWRLLKSERAEYMACGLRE